MHNKNIFLIFFSIIWCISFGIIIGLIIANHESLSYYQIPLSEQEIVNNCLNKSVEKTAYCLRDNIETFFKYQVTDDKFAEEMSLNQIKELGTDCGGYAYLYDRLSKRLNINSTTNNYKGLKDVYPGHRWAVIWDNETYCKLDQLSVDCSPRKFIEQ